MKAIVTTLITITTAIIMTPIILMSCGTQTPTSNKECIAITIDNTDIGDSLTIRKLLKINKYIALETKQNSLFRRIKKIELKNDTLYILADNSLFIFDQNGHHVRTISRLGRASNEYMSLDDIIISEDAITLYDGSQGKLLTFKGDKISTQNVEKGNSIIPLDQKYLIHQNNGVADNSEQKQHFQYVVYENGELINYAIPFCPHMTGRTFSYGNGKSTFYKFDDHIFVTADNNDTIYKINNLTAEATPFMAFNILGTERPQTNWTSRQTDEYLRQLTYNEIPSSIYGLNRSGDRTLVSFMTAKGTTTVITSGTQVIFQGKMRDENGLPILATSALCDKNNILLGVLSPKIVLNMENGNSKIAALQEHLSEDSNPIIAIYDWITLPQ